MADMKRCPKCTDIKPLEDFYGDRSSADKRSSYCKLCDNARPKKATPSRTVRNRARHRAVAELIAQHPEEFAALYADAQAEVWDEWDGDGIPADLPRPTTPTPSLRGHRSDSTDEGVAPVRPLFTNDEPDTGLYQIASDMEADGASVKTTAAAMHLTVSQVRQLLAFNEASRMGLTG